MVLKTGMERGAAISYDRLEDVAVVLAARATLNPPAVAVDHSLPPTP